MAALLKVYFAITAQIPLGPGRSATTAAGFVAPALSDVLYGAWNAAQGTGKGNAGFLADLAQSARENRQKYQAGRARLDLFDMPGVLAFAGTENLSDLKASHAKWQAGMSVTAEVVETVAPASREAKAEDAPDYTTMTLEAADRLYTETGDERALARVEELRTRMAQGAAAPAAVPVAAQTEAPVSSPASVAISRAAAESANAAANTEITQGLFSDPAAQLAVLRTDPSADRNKQAAEAFGAGLRAAVSTAVPWADDGLRAAAARASEAITAVGYVSPKLASGAWLAVGSDARRRGNADAVEQISTMLRNAKLGTTVLMGEYTTAARTIQPAVAEVGRRVRQAPVFDAAAATLGYAAAMTTGIKDADAAARAAGRAMKSLGLITMKATDADTRRILHMA
jgi:hypothetical protein